MKINVIFVAIFLISLEGYGQESVKGRKFEQMETMLPTPNSYRTASGAPGHEYWQQKADYVIDVELDDENQTISGFEVITYTNNSPDPLSYFWLQLEQNMRNVDSDSYSTANSYINQDITEGRLKSLIGHSFDLGFNILEVKDMKGNDLPYTINKTMMRVNLPETIHKGQQFIFSVKWNYNINDRKAVGGRSGMEFFPEDGNYLYTIAQFFPRMAVYDDVNGWQNKQFLGRGEFTLPFGDYKVRITVPSDHIIAATGELQNPEDVLTVEQIALFDKAKTSSEPVIIVSQEEVEKKEKEKAKDKKVWEYHADNVRDFAFGSSRKLIWDAMGVNIAGKPVMAMSYYPKEANPLYEEFSTRVVAQTLKTYSKYTIDYPYPVAISVEASNGMEYPMICFNYGRPNKDGVYSDRLKRGMISVIIHEVGHNFFPMIINSDERQWSWMDEGLNTFVQYLTEQEWDPNYPSRRGPPEKIVPYMKGSKDYMVPIMTNSEQVKQFGSNAYAKPATALNILRETIMGPELFDYAFKEYSKRWAFKHPSPADFFRTMEDASAVDLDWFWKGWFYTTDNVDIEVADVNWYKYDDKIEEEASVSNKERQKKKKRRSGGESGGIDTKGFTPDDIQSPEEKLLIPKPLKTTISETDELINADQNFYEVNLKNQGGLVMPVILQFNFRDGSSEIKRIPAEIWRLNEGEVTKVFVLDKELENVVLDPFKETADVNEANNHFPPKEIPSDFQRYKENNK
ncbi:MAG: M1 family metallopeptidase [Cyclobacteriaceae bacterium]|nr:M1 family metallopeptidase [Cyclobacteriaceae bacterium]